MEPQQQVIINHKKHFTGTEIERFDIAKEFQFDHESQAFDTSKIPRILIIAKSQSGKSWIIRDIIYSIREHIPYGVIISPTNQEQQFYNQFFPDSFIYEQYKPDFIQKLIHFQQVKSIQLKKMKPFNRTMLLVMDDLAYDKKLLESTDFGQLMFNSRHSHIFFIYTTQSISQVPPKIRNNFSHVFILKNDQQSDRRTIKESFCGNLDMDEFKQLYNTVTHDFGALVVEVNKNVQDDQRFSKYKIFKARDLDQVPFFFGSEDFWRTHKRKYDKEKQQKIALTQFKEQKKNKDKNKKLEFLLK